jgi:hypothetical protein
VARTKEAYSDGSTHVEWFNTKDGTGNAGLKYWKAYTQTARLKQEKHTR